jgi:predicted ribosomally synthesized peptide with SipW-like signal peptide
VTNLSPFKKILLSVSALGILAAAVGGGTFATFNATTNNPNNTFTTGTLVLTNTVASGTTCLSTGGGAVGAANSNGLCDTIFNMTNQKPGASSTFNVTIKNDGSLDADASGLQLYTNGCTNANNGAVSYHGSGDLCLSTAPNALELYVQQWTDATLTTAKTCVYGGGTATTCAFSTAKTVGGFANAHTTQGTSQAIVNSVAHPFDHATTDYFTIGVQLDSTADNSVQGLKLTTDFTWYISQS